MEGWDGTARGMFTDCVYLWQAASHGCFRKARDQMRNNERKSNIQLWPPSKVFASKDSMLCRTFIHFKWFIDLTKTTEEFHSPTAQHVWQNDARKAQRTQTESLCRQLMGCNKFSKCGLNQGSQSPDLMFSVVRHNRKKSFKNVPPNIRLKDLEFMLLFAQLRITRWTQLVQQED